MLRLQDLHHSCTLGDFKKSNNHHLRGCWWSSRSWTSSMAAYASPPVRYEGFSLSLSLHLISGHSQVHVFGFTIRREGAGNDTNKRAIKKHVFKSSEYYTWGTCKTLWTLLYWQAQKKEMLVWLEIKLAHPVGSAGAAGLTDFLTPARALAALVYSLFLMASPFALSLSSIHLRVSLIKRFIH